MSKNLSARKNLSTRRSITVDLADRFKITLHEYHSVDERDITLYAPTIENLISQTSVAMVLQLFRPDAWELESCQVLIHNGKVYEVEDSVEDIKTEHSTLIGDITLTDSYKKAFEERQEEENARLRNFRKNFRENYKKELKLMTAEKKKEEKEENARKEREKRQ